jgi:hypothetical protein
LDRRPTKRLDATTLRLPFLRETHALKQGRKPAHLIALTELTSIAMEGRKKGPTVEMS